MKIEVCCHDVTCDWQNKVQGINDQSIKGILACYEKATKHDPNWYKAWHSWAFMNFKVVQAKKHLTQDKINQQPGNEETRVAILWHEQWHEGLEEASRLYFGERNIKGMFATLEPLHAMLERGPQTLKETSFYQAYGRDLTEALEWCQHYKVN